MAASNATSAILSEIETNIKSFTLDPLSAIQSIDFQTVVSVGLTAVFLVFLVDLAAYMIAVYKGETEEFQPYSRSIAVMAADAWDNRDENEIGYYYDPYARSRSVERLTPVLDSLSSAVHKRWDQQQ